MRSGYKTTLQALPEPCVQNAIWYFTADRSDNPYQLIPTDWLETGYKALDEARPSLPLACIGVDVHVAVMTKPVAYNFGMETG